MSALARSTRHTKKFVDDLGGGPMSCPRGSDFDWLWYKREHGRGVCASDSLSLKIMRWKGRCMMPGAVDNERGSVHVFEGNQGSDGNRSREAPVVGCATS